MIYTTLTIEERNNIITLTINRPEKLNALSVTVLTELRHYLSGFQKHSPAARGLIVTGSGEKAFIAGADIKEMHAMNPSQGEEFGQLGQDVTCLLESLPVPVIAAVNGFAFGGGCEIAMSCDFIYAVESAAFGQPEVNLGLIPGFGGCVRLFRRVGPSRAKEMIYTGMRITATEAERIGLINKVFYSVQLMRTAAETTLLEISRKSSLAVSVCKEIINFADGHTVDEGLEMEKQGFRLVFENEDMREGTEAFLNKRPAQFGAKEIYKPYLFTLQNLDI